MRLLLICLMLTSIVIGCATNKAKMVDTEFNWKEFTGLLSGKVDRYEDAILDYSLYTRENEELHFSSCPQVDDTDEETIVESQFYLFQMLSRNCKALKLYLQEGQKAKISYFQEPMSEKEIRQWPAMAGPILNDEERIRRQGKILEAYETELAISVLDRNTIKVITGTDEITYCIMARGDFNHDGIEDLLVRMSWHVRDAFGKGTDLFILEKRAPAAPIQVAWRN